MPCDVSKYMSESHFNDIYVLNAHYDQNLSSEILEEMSEADFTGTLQTILTIIIEPNKPNKAC